MCMRSVLQEMATSSCSTARHGRRTAFHVTHRPVSTVTDRQSWFKAFGFTDVKVRPSADSSVWREVPKPTRCYGHQPSVSDLSPGTMLQGEETSCTMHRRSRWTVIGTIFISSFRTGGESDLVREKTSHISSSSQRWWLPLRMSAL